MSNLRKRSTRIFRLAGLVALSALFALSLALALRHTAARAQAILPTPTPDPQLAQAEAQYAPGELLVTMRADAAAMARSANAVAAASALDVEVLASFDVSGPDDDLFFYKVSTPPGREYDVAALLAGQPGVVSVEPNWYVYAAEEPRVQPGFAVTDTFYTERQWNLQRINTARAWQLLDGLGNLTAPAREIVVAVIDSGIDITHTDFVGRLLPGYNYISEGLVTNPPMKDDCGHGTHVAGIIGSALNDGVGTAGVAPFVKIDPRRVFNALCSGTIDNLALAIHDAAADGADIINMSVEYYSSGDGVDPVSAALQYAESQGVLLIAAAGNQRAVVAKPGSYPQVMAVAALNINDKRAIYSNPGSEVEIAAPGGEGDQITRVLSAWPSHPVAVNRCNSNNGGVLYDTTQIPAMPYCYSSGTSQASPTVAGVAALLWAMNPDLTAAEVRSALRNTASPLEQDAVLVGAGKVDALAALRSQLPSDLTLTPAAKVAEVVSGGAPFTLTVRVDNPSLDNIDWTATLSTTIKASASITGFAAITLTSGAAGEQGGFLVVGQPAFLTLRIDAAEAGPGLYTSGVTVLGTRTDGSTVTRTFPLEVVVRPIEFLPRVWAPMLALNSSLRGNAVPTSQPYTWLSPPNPEDRAILTMTDESSATVTLPFPVTLGQATHNSLRVYSDGFVVLPQELPILPSPAFSQAVNSCLPTVGHPENAVYGWWANLNPEATSAQISTFAVGADQFVIEYAGVQSQGAAQPYAVSFQIVLHTNGDLLLNYGIVPDFVGAPEAVTIGVESQDSRFYNLVACATPAHVWRTLPRSEQSYLIRAGDIY